MTSFILYHLHPLKRQIQVKKKLVKIEIQEVLHNLRSGAVDMLVLYCFHYDLFAFNIDSAKKTFACF